MSVIYLVADDCGMTVKSEVVDAWTYVKMQQMCKYFYDVREWYEADGVVSRAESMVDAPADRLPFKDAHHFAIWCKTGSHQLHC